jgi:hypothetical protein
MIGMVIYMHISSKRVSVKVDKIFEQEIDPSNTSRIKLLEHTVIDGYGHYLFEVDGRTIFITTAGSAIELKEFN